MFHSKTFVRVGLLAFSLMLGACSTPTSAPTPTPSPDRTPVPMPQDAPIDIVGRTLLTIGARLTGDQEVPYNEANGIGNLTGTFDPRTRVLKWRIVYSGLSSPVTMAHFHGPAARQHNAGVVIAFPNPASPIVGQATLTEAQARDLMRGLWYVNVHTKFQPGGEIRGQVMVS
jgi:hypothetical protein